MITLRLYLTSHCHLCEQAKLIINEANLTPQTNYVEISNDEALILEYGTRIPVLKRMDNSHELNWPFTYSEMLSFVAS